MRILKPVVFSMLLVMLLVMTACSKNVVLYKQALKEYNQGNFETSLRSNVQSLQLKPGYEKAQDLIKNSYPKAISVREQRVADLQKSSDPAVWGKLVVEYQALEDLQNLVKPINPLWNPKTGMGYTFQIKDYSRELAESKTNAAEYHYNLGVNLTKSGSSPDIQKQAAKEFQQALSYVPNYKDSDARYQAARKLAVKRIAITPFEDKTGLKSKYGGISEILTESVISSLVQDKTAGEFLEIIARDQMTAVLSEQQLSTSGLVDESSAANIGMLLGAHEIMTGKILQVNYVAPRTTSVELKESANVVVSEETYVDEEGKERTRSIKGDVFCTYTRYTKTSNVQITASFTIVDVATGKIKLQNTVSAEQPWTDSWARKGTGDERALSPATKALITKSEPLPPSDAEMVNVALRGLSADIVSKIKDYVK